jgi:hypothetical protein
MLESELLKELKFLEIPDKPAKELLARLKEEGFVTKQKSGKTTADGAMCYRFGGKTELEIGRRAVLQFLMCAVCVSLDEDDEEKFLQLPEEEDAEEQQA